MKRFRPVCTTYVHIRTYERKQTWFYECFSLCNEKIGFFNTCPSSQRKPNTCSILDLLCLSLCHPIYLSVFKSSYVKRKLLASSLKWMQLSWATFCFASATLPTAADCKPRASRTCKWLEILEKIVAHKNLPKQKIKNYSFLVRHANFLAHNSREFSQTVLEQWSG